MLVFEQEQKCNKCGEIKHISNFRIHTGNNKPRKQCKRCYQDVQNKSPYQQDKEKKAKRHKIWREERGGKLKKKDKDLQYKFGITLEDYNRMKSEQNDRCYLCDKHQSQVKLQFAVDHCHETGVVRKLLCSNCNTGLGQFKDNIEVLTKAIEYLKSFKQE